MVNIYVLYHHDVTYFSGQHSMNQFYSDLLKHCEKNLGCLMLQYDLFKNHLNPSDITVEF